MKKTFSLLLISSFCLGACADKGDPPQEPNSEEKPAESEGALSESADGDFPGLSLEEAEALAEKRGMPHRVTSIDGESQPATADYRPDRVNFELENGKVTKVTRG